MTAPFVDFRLLTPEPTMHGSAFDIDGMDFHAHKARRGVMTIDHAVKYRGQWTLLKGGARDSLTAEMIVKGQRRALARCIDPSTGEYTVWKDHDYLGGFPVRVVKGRAFFDPSDPDSMAVFEAAFRGRLAGVSAEIIGDQGTVRDGVTYHKRSSLYAITFATRSTGHFRADITHVSPYYSEV